MMGRTPDYLNVTFACFAGRADVWARRDNEQGAANLVAYQQRDARSRPLDHALDHEPAGRPHQARGRAGDAGEVALHKVGETENHITVRGARMLATLAPFADELMVYPGSDIRPQDGRYALSFAIPMATPGLRFICRDATRKQRDPFDYPLSSRFDEMDAVAIFDDVEVPKERVFLDGDTVGYSRGDLRHRLARPHHAPGLHPRLRQALVRARPRAPDRQHDRGRPLRPHPGEAGPDLDVVELTRSALVAAEAGAYVDEGGVWYPDDRPFLALRGEMPKWLPRVNELLQQLVDVRKPLRHLTAERQERPVVGIPDAALVEIRAGLGSHQRRSSCSSTTLEIWPSFSWMWSKRTTRSC